MREKRPVGRPPKEGERLAKRITLRMDVQMYEALRECAKESDKDLAESARAAIQRGLEKQRKPKESAQDAV